METVREERARNKKDRLTKQNKQDAIIIEKLEQGYTQREIERTTKISRRQITRVFQEQKDKLRMLDKRLDIINKSKHIEEDDEGENIISDEVEEALETFKIRIKNYVTINHYGPGYGYARLDAFGRIYNRALEHLLNKDAITSVLTDMLDTDELKEVTQHINESIVNNNEFDHLFEKLQKILTVKQVIKIRDLLFNKANAPVSPLLASYGGCK